MLNLKIKQSMKTFKTFNSLATMMLSGIVACALFNSCSDDKTLDTVENHSEETTTVTTDLANFEAYGLTYQNFITPGDVQILNADTTQISVSKALAEKLGIKTFVNHPLGIWHNPGQLPYLRKAEAETLEGDRYVLTVKPATIADVTKGKKFTMATDIYVNNDAKSRTTRADGTEVPEYAAKYMDEDDVIHPAVILMTDPYGYSDKVHYENDPLASVTRADGSYQYFTADDVANGNFTIDGSGTLFNVESELSREIKIGFGPAKGDTVEVYMKAPIAFNVNYRFYIDTGVEWKWAGWWPYPSPYLSEFEASVNGKMAIAPEVGIKYSGRFGIDDDDEKRPICSFTSFTVTFWLGPVPVAVTFTPNLFWMLKANVEGTFSGGYKYEYERDFKAGVYYSRGGGWRTISETNVVKNEGGFTPASMEFSATLGAGIYFGVDMKLYSIAGPNLAIGPDITAQAKLSYTPSEEKPYEFEGDVSCGVKMIAEAELKVWDFEIARWGTSVSIGDRFTFWHYPYTDPKDGEKSSYKFIDTLLETLNKE